MLTGKALGQAIETAIQRKIAAGGARSKAEIAFHFGVKPPSVYDWIKKGAISKDKLPELWRYFSDVVGPTHWGMSAWPGGGTPDAGQVEQAKDAAQSLIPAASPRSQEALRKITAAAEDGRLTEEDMVAIQRIAERIIKKR
jgi:hypothetical protein